MPGSTGAGLSTDADRAVVAEVGRRYDSNVHLRNTADHTSPLTAEFVDRFAIVGPPEACVDRVRELVDLGIERFVITGASFGADRDAAQTSARLLTGEVLPGIREGAAAWATTT
jgi:5,10-methylenetetrahydromethanopterin reductase